MTKNNEKNSNVALAEKPDKELASSEAEQQQVKLRVDERAMSSTYSNAFRTNGTAEEVMLDFGVNMVNPASQQVGQQTEITFKINDRIIMNYYSAKRMAITLGQLIRRHEDQFGELELDVAKRTKTAKSDIGA